MGRDDRWLTAGVKSVPEPRASAKALRWEQLGVFEEEQKDRGLGKRCLGEKGRPLLGRLVGPPRGSGIPPGGCRSFSQGSQGLLLRKQT